MFLGSREAGCAVVLAAAIFATCALTCASGPARAQAPGAGAAVLPEGVTALGPVTVPSSERFRFESKSVAKPFLIEVVRVDAPLAPPRPEARLPVVFITDNDAFSALLPAIVRSGAVELFPSMLIVGIGYDTSAATTFVEGFSQFGIRRAVDFTPTVDEAYLAQIKAATEMLRAPWPAGVELGGAGAFLRFIDRELKPFLAARYPANVNDSTLVGHSLGGLFALHVLFTSPDSFTRYVALSPAAHYGDEVLLREERAFGDAAARLFIGLADADVPQILESTRRLDAQIRERARPTLHYGFELFSGENHTSVVPGGLMAGLRAVLDPPPFAPPPPAGSAQPPQ